MQRVRVHGIIWCAVEHLLDSMTVSLTGALQQTEEIVRSYLSNNSVRINDTKAMIALAHASWTGMKLFSDSTTGNIIDKLIVPPSDWKWDEVIDGWSYEEGLAPTIDLRARTVRGALYSNRVTALLSIHPQSHCGPLPLYGGPLCIQTKRTPK
jgi:hypothetical protein